MPFFSRTLASPSDPAQKYGFSSFRKPGMMRRTFRKNTREICSWIAFTTIIGLVYKFASDGTFSAILTLSSLFQCFAFALLLVKVVKHSSAGGISLNSLVLFLIATCSRLYCNLSHHAYLPVDKSGDWVYQVADGITATLLASLIFLIYHRYWTSYSQDMDCIWPNKPYLTILAPTTFMFLACLVVRPKLAGSAAADIAWSFGLYTECIAMLPQLILMGRVGGEVEMMTSNYVVSVAVAKLLSFAFWLASFRELSHKKAINFAGYGVLCAHILQLVLLADFLYQFVKALRAGRRLILNI